jgi:hypothetical protein
MTVTPTVARSPPALIAPAWPTPGGRLPLSSIDKMVAALVNLIQVFPPSSLSPAPSDQGAAVAAMRNGFTRALVPYYPVAGRIIPSGLVVDCTGEGVWFMDCTGEAVSGSGVEP